MARVAFQSDGSLTSTCPFPTFSSVLASVFHSHMIEAMRIDQLLEESHGMTRHKSQGDMLTGHECAGSDLRVPGNKTKSCG